jgi:hypothetical protein
MDQTYNPHEGGSNLGRGYGRQIHYLAGQDKIEQAFNETFAYKACKVTLRTEKEPRGVWVDVHGFRSDTFDLSEIDPESIKIHIYDFRGGGNCADPDEVQRYGLNCQDAEVAFATRNDSPTIDEDSLTIFEQLQGADHEARSKSKESQAVFIIEDAAYAQRFAKAFRHAVELCGGKTSKF